MDNNYNNDPNNLSGQNNDPYGQNSGYSNAQQNDPYGQNSGYSNAQQNAPYGQNGGYGSAPQNNQYGQNGYNDPYGQNPYNSAPDFYSNVNQGFGEDNSGKATASMVCGIISLILWCIPIAGLALSIVAITLGNKSKDSINGGRAKAGCIMGYIGLAISIVIWVLNIFLRLS